ncbi:UDP-N-acetylmuramate--L-alanine ligase [Abeliophyllum distichum]|uniref:UDP-N-acetylmuramate--L-alanine ligase n=1 Tax=Abeliophyllum distichum TaxID=126358 RepID=A0ABD1UQV9_9LAMI
MKLSAANLPEIRCPLYIPSIRGQDVPPMSTCKTNYIWTRVPSRKLNRHGKISVCANLSDGENIETFESKNRKKKSWIHFIGVGGCGLSALAMLALKQGYEVSGSDIVWSIYMDALKVAGAHLYIGHSELNLGKGNFWGTPDAIVISSAIPPDNVEILHAKSLGIPVYKRGVWLGKLTEDYNLIAVSGSHGKSTTTSMLAYVLKAMGDDLTAVIGAQVPQFSGGNAIHGNSHNFVLEADEYDACFLELSPHVAVVTNVDWEHADIFQDEEAVKTAFRRFLGKIRIGGQLILCGDRYDQNPGAYSLLSHPKQVSGISDHMELCAAHLYNKNYRVTTYGMSDYNEWRASSICFNSQGGCDYKLYHKGHSVVDISLRIPGVHNVLNSLAVVATMSSIFGDERKFYESIDIVRFHLNKFKGVCRRFEMIGKVHECHIFDDYAHHPTEVRAVIQTARQMFPSKELLVVFQPHTYSRLAALKSEFASAFVHANQVLITEIYAARETNFWSISTREFAMSIIGPPCEFIPRLDDVVDKLALWVSMDPVRPLVILTLGAGDITNVGRKLLQKLKQTLP